MARPREFDADEALDRTMRLFWARGYQATSVQDLMKAAGVRKQSLYGAFGNKRSLFLKCLDVYSQQTLSEIQRMLTETDSAFEGIERVMRFVTQSPESKKCPPGCLMANTALEVGLKDPDIATEVRRMFRATERILADAVRKAQSQGDAASNLDPAAVAQGLANTINGIRVLEKTGASRQQIRAVVDTALAAIRR